MTTKLEEGIFVKINKVQLQKLKEEQGFLEKEYYPDSYKKIALDNEIGRYRLFRFLSDFE